MRILHNVFQSGKIDLIICDEGHRLKNGTIKTVLAAKQLPVERRIILTGTPLQNDLSEFYAMCDFVNPQVLGHYSEFKVILSMD
jgi:DNA repair and recombination protein RAD54B